jgi:hypothetical protein
MGDDARPPGSAPVGGRRHGVGAACAALIAFQGVCHEAVGAVLFPYGPDLFGGLAAWHAFGLVIVAVGAYLFAEVLRGTWRHVTPLSLVVVLVAAAVFGLALLRYGDFHVFALTGVVSGAGLIACDRRR